MDRMACAIRFGFRDAVDDADVLRLFKGDGRKSEAAGYGEEGQFLHALSLSWLVSGA
jgi:hypothetical protein